jgi:transcriptional regulator NrdR family protein
MVRESEAEGELRAMTLSRITGPSCPDCGCESSEVEQSKLWGMSQERRRCNNCGCRWTTKGEPWPTKEQAVEGEAVQPKAVLYHPPPACPACEAPAASVSRTMPAKKGEPRVRYHKCDDCGHTFKSIEGAK